MKLHRLDVEGFGPFRQPQIVDFDAFENDGIFLISGRTGSGKSSILDAVCFALFGSIPRYEGSEKRIRSDHSTPEDTTRVALEFSAAGGRWRVTRSPDYERPKARGEGLTTVPHAAQLDELVAGGWVTRAARPREVSHLLDEIVGLNQQQFLQVILLAQGRFAQFLLAKNDERQSLLRTLFGTRVYQDYQVALDERRKTAARELERAGDGTRMLLAEAQLLIDEHGFGGDDGLDTPLDPARGQSAVERAVQRANYRSETLARVADEAEAGHVAAVGSLSLLTSIRARQVDRDHARTALEVLELAERAIAADRAELARALAAESLRAPIDNAGRVRREAELAVAAEQEARIGWIGSGADRRSLAVDTADAPALRTLIDAMTGDLTLWQAAADQEPALRDAIARLTQSRREVDEGEAALAQLDAQRSALPAERAAVEAELDVLDGAAVTLDVARAEQATIEQRVAAAAEADRRADDMRDAERIHAQRLVELEAAIAEVSALLRRRLDGFAGELALSLVDGEPCAVCGALEHPRPAEHADEPVTSEAIAAAEARKDAAAARDAAASTAARAARAAHAAADARAGGASTAALTRALEEATSTTRNAEAAVQQRAKAVRRRNDLDELEAAARLEHEALTAHVIAAREIVAVTVEKVSTLQASVDAARGDHASVAERIAVVTAQRRAARALADAQELRAVREAAVEAAVRDRDARVAASDFADADAATTALRDEASRESLSVGIRAHEMSLATARDRLRELELELAGEPEALIDLGDAEATVATARARWRDAADQATRADEAATRLGGLGSRIAAAQQTTAELVAAHDLVAELANAVAGRTARRMDLETFVLAAELEEIVSAANLRLDEMSSGRYRLAHSDAVAVRNGASGLGLEVLDAYTGRARPAQSLSGGETFLASLALALGLAEVVTGRAGGIRLDTLFVDEGFGSLDAETLDLAMRTLDELRQGGRTVGVISHVEAMKEQLPAQVLVEATAAGPSRIRQDLAVGA